MINPENVIHDSAFGDLKEGDPLWVAQEVFRWLADNHLAMKVRAEKAAGLDVFDMVQPISDELTTEPLPFTIKRVYEMVGGLKAFDLERMIPGGRQKTHVTYGGLDGNYASDFEAIKKEKEELLLKHEQKRFDQYRAHQLIRDRAEREEAQAWMDNLKRGPKVSWQAKLADPAWGRVYEKHQATLDKPVQTYRAPSVNTAAPKSKPVVHKKPIYRSTAKKEAPAPARTGTASTPATVEKSSAPAVKKEVAKVSAPKVASQSPKPRKKVRWSKAKGFFSEVFFKSGR